MARLEAKYASKEAKLDAKQAKLDRVEARLYQRYKLPGEQKTLVMKQEKLAEKQAKLAVERQKLAVKFDAEAAKKTCQGPGCLPCAPGEAFDNGCRPPGYISACDPGINESNCLARNETLYDSTFALGPVDCSGLEGRMNNLGSTSINLQWQAQDACNQDPGSQRCSDLTQRFQEATGKYYQARQALNDCRLHP